MKTYSSLVLSILVLAGAVVGTLFWAQAFFDSLRNNQSPVANTTFTTRPTNVDAAAQVVVVLVSGLSETTLDQYSLPNLAQISQTGASTIIQGTPPTYAQTSKMTVVTGAPAETNGAPPVDVPPAQLPIIDTDTIFSPTHDAGRTTALLGPVEWSRFVPRNHLDQTYFVNGSGPEADQIIFENAQLILQNDNVDLLFINLTQLAFAAKFQGGTGGAAYRQAVEQIDAYLGQFYQTVDFGQQVLVILGDHGLTDSGGQGGGEPELTRRPLVMIGDSIVPGSYSQVSQHDVAPTVTTLLGVSPPALAQGRILFELLRLDEPAQTLAQLALARHRLDLMQAYQAAVTGQPVDTDLMDDLQQAELLLAQKNVSGAFELARLAQRTADTQMAVTRFQGIRAEQLPRLAVAILAFLIFAGVLWRRRGKYFSIIVIAAILTVALYHILYQLQGFGYSISTINNFSDWPFTIGRSVAVSLLAGGGFLLVVLMLTGEEHWASLLGTSFGFSVLVTFVFSIPLFWAFWQHGLVATWYLPAVDVAFWQINALYETMVAAILGLILPWPTMLLIMFVGLVRRTLDKPSAQPKSDAVPGLRL
jgi:hypothetical protein